MNEAESFHLQMNSFLEKNWTKLKGNEINDEFENYLIINALLMVDRFISTYRDCTEVKGIFDMWLLLFGTGKFHLGRIFLKCL